MLEVYYNCTISKLNECMQLWYYCHDVLDESVTGNQSTDYKVVLISQNDALYF